MRLLWTVKQLAGLVYDWPTELAGLSHDHRQQRQKVDQRRLARMLTRRGIPMVADGRSRKVSSKALRELYPEVWDELSAASVAHGCPNCGADVECTECSWTSDEAA